MRKALLLSLALQNLGRRKARSLLLVAAVALGSGVVFTGAVLMQSIDRSMEVGFARLGADLMVVPEGPRVRLVFRRIAVDWLGIAASLAGVLAVAWLARRNRRHG